MGLLSFSVPAYAFGYVTGAGKLTKPTTSQPAKGASIVDSATNMTITRVTNVASEAPGAGLMGIQYDYIDPINANGTYMILSDSECSLFLYQGPAGGNPWQFIRQIPPDTLGWTDSWGCGSQEARWDATDPNIFYFVVPGNNNGNGTPLKSGYACTLRKITISNNGNTLTESLVHDFKNDFPGCTYIGTGSEGNPSDNSRYWGLMVNDYPTSGTTTFFIYDKTNNTISNTSNTTRTINKVQISPDGDYFEVWMQGDPYTRPVYRVSDFPNTSWNGGVGGHNTWARLADGKEVIWHQNEGNDTVAYHDPSLLSLNNTTVMNQECYYGQGGCWGMHPDRIWNGNGWGIIGTYESGTIDEGLYWGYPNQIFAVRLLPIASNPVIWRIAFTRSSSNRYFGQLISPVTRYKGSTGGYIFFNSDWENGSGKLDTYVATLPATWQTDLGGSDVTPPAAPVGVTVN